ncbi:MAG TPA: glycosyltransferase family 4 protein [Candidatus Saccharimonadales bacterium]|nr:glycosyltransferase family 4 protein [Candidatus Saccharimonadales bacterium]
MKIGLVCPYSVARGGGVKEHVYAIQEELLKRGHEAYIVTPQPRDMTIDSRKHVIFIGASVDMRSPIGTTGQVSASGDVDAIDEMLAREKFDILHFHAPEVPVLSRQILSRSNAVNIGTFHTTYPDSITGRTFTKVIAPYAMSIVKYLDEMTAVSDTAASFIGSLTDRPMAIIPNGIDLSVFKPAPKKPAAGKTVLYVGRLEARKGVKYLLKAFAALAQEDPDVRLLLIGDGTDRSKLEALAATLGIPSDRVTFAGYLSDEEKIDALQQADVFCAPALYGESFGIVLVEAMACNTPTIAGDNPGYAGVMQGAGSLSLVDPKDTDNFVRRLRVFLDDDEFRKLWKKWAKNEVVQYGFDRVVDAYEELYIQAYKNKHKKLPR